jgi:hypothetical protein
VTSLTRQRPHASRSTRGREIDTRSLAVLFVALVSIAVGLVGVAGRGTTPLVLIPGVIAGVLALLHVFRPTSRR